MKNWLQRNKLYIIGAIIGAVAGYLYWQQIGCVSGTCAITSKPLNSTLYGALLGLLAFGIFKKEKKQEILKEEDHDISRDHK